MKQSSFDKLLYAKKLKNPEYLPKEKSKNIYDAFVDHLRTRKIDFNSAGVLEKHHVVPLHKSKIKRGSFKDKTQEVLIVTYEEHFTAHFYHYLVYKLPGDLMFLQLRSRVGADKATLARQLGGKTAGNMNTDAQQRQRQKHLKPHPENLNPSKAGSVGSPAQKAHSSKIGKIYGRKAGMSRQNSITAERIRRPIKWVHESGQVVFIEKAETIQEIMEILNSHVLGSVKFSSGLSSLLRRVEKKRYGWMLVDE
jgi:hypothetical protein